MKKLTSILLCLFIGGLTILAQNVRLLKTPVKYVKAGSYEPELKKPFIWINETQFYTNYGWLKKNEKPYVYLKDIPTASAIKTDISIAGGGEFAKFVNFDFGDKQLSLVKVFYKDQKRTDYYTYTLENTTIKPDVLLFSVEKKELDYFSTFMEGPVKFLKSSSNNRYYLSVIEEPVNKEIKYTYIIFDSQFNLVDSKTIQIPKGTEQINLEDASISNSGQVLSVYHYKNLDGSVAFLYVSTLDDDNAAPIRLDFKKNGSYTNVKINHYSNEDANIVVGIQFGEERGYMTFDTQNEADSKIEGVLTNFNGEGSKYVYSMPSIDDCFTFPNGNQVYIFKMDLTKGSNTLVNCLKIMVISPEHKIITQYDIIRDIGGTFSSINDYCYITFYENNLYVFYNGLKGNSDDYKFEDVAKQKDEQKLVKYLKINSEGKISDFGIEGTETFYFAKEGTERTGNRIVSRICTGYRVGGLVEFGL